jgi:hypothetical protein
LKHDLNGSGTYRRKVPDPTKSESYPKIYQLPPVGIKAIEVNGEIYLRAKDVCINLQRASYCFSSSLSVLNFVRCFIINLLNLTMEDDQC